ncbi:MAG: phosphoglycerate kinase [Hyphomonadaceae bacterium]
MGLDMYAFTTERSAITTPVDFKPNRNGDGIAELHYWRKHPNLHGWMEALYRRKGGKSPDFNCDTVELTLADLDDLEAAVRAGTLPSTAGFFFGASDGTEHEDDLAFVAKARAAIADGLVVYYDSWW